MSKENLKKLYNGEILEFKREKEISKEYMQRLIDNEEAYESATHLYTQSLIKNIQELEEKHDKSAREREVLLKYLKELEGILQIKSNIWHGFTPTRISDHDDEFNSL